MLFYFRKGKNATQTTKKICTVHGDGAVSVRMVQRWFMKFSNADFTLSDSFFAKKDSNFWKNGILQLPIRWQKVIEPDGHYIIE
ncbi:hypothetical protein WN55_04300 [Dufourea novaeangliae]|uniref:Mos1 transposase HTH domain-containing protein n=1 Tax=Dufourea novaeangliae TaxID=178035 RepID=A0A154PN84_DUFNO|nr:hypothetical protein WN55_04300 [Dufourea novaeangliae]